MLKPILALALVASMYGLYWFGQANGAEAMLVDARATYADYEDTLAHAQQRYDDLLTESNATIAELEMEARQAGIR